MRLWRVNVGLARYGETVVRYGLPGMADLSGILSDGRRLEIEVKSATGRQSDAQKNYQRMIERFGGIYLVAHSLPEALAQLRQRGYCHG